MNFSSVPGQLTEPVIPSSDSSISMLIGRVLARLFVTTSLHPIGSVTSNQLFMQVLPRYGVDNDMMFELQRVRIVAYVEGADRSSARPQLVILYYDNHDRLGLLQIRQSVDPRTREPDMQIISNESLQVIEGHNDDAIIQSMLERGFVQVLSKGLSVFHLPE